MERKIGEIFEYNGEWYQCIKGLNCLSCVFNGSGICDKMLCSLDERTDSTSIFFKKLEKVGEPYMLEDKKFQKYKVFKTPYIYNKIDCSWQSFADPYYVSLEIKQNKEDMEEKKLNLKPFDLQKAREGKPVCTMDGRKARIICFDRNDLYPIVALIECEDGKEIIGAYSKEGQTDIYEIKGTDLMMLPEKKEGWVNVYKGGLLDTKSYPTKKEAFDKASLNDYVDTVKITWEE